MKKLGYLVAALAAIIIAAPSMASAHTVVIKRGGYHQGHHHGHGARAHYRSHRAWHREHRHGHGHRKVVIIKKRSYY